MDLCCLNNNVGPVICLMCLCFKRNWPWCYACAAHRHVFLQSGFLLNWMSMIGKAAIDGMRSQELAAAYNRGVLVGYLNEKSQFF